MTSVPTGLESSSNFNRRNEVRNTTKPLVNKTVLYPHIQPGASSLILSGHSHFYPKLSQVLLHVASSVKYDLGLCMVSFNLLCSKRNVIVVFLLHVSASFKKLQQMKLRTYRSYKHVMCPQSSTVPTQTNQTQT